MHVHSCRYDQLKKRSSECWKPLLQEIQATGPAQERGNLEQAAGVRYSADGLLSDPWVLYIIKFPECKYLDSARCILGSGSIGQFTVNQFVRALVGKTEVSFKDLDTHVSSVKFRHERPRPTKTYSQDRINLRPGSDLWDLHRKQCQLWKC